MFYTWIGQLGTNKNRWFQSSYSEKKPTANSRYTINKIVIFIEIFSVSENQFNIELYNQIYTIKMYVVEKKSQGGSFYNIKFIVTKYLNIAI
jgi:hypothetical protein